MNGARRFPWRRLATLALAWVVVGFTINALMVVALARWSKGTVREHRAIATRDLVIYERGFGLEQVWNHSWRHSVVLQDFASAPSWVDLQQQSAQPRDGQIAVGWPVRAFTGWTANTDAKGWFNQDLVGLYLLPSNAKGPVPFFQRAVPYIPLWRGVAINTLVLGSPALLLLLITPVRASRRRRNGECPRCAYDLKRDFARGCPECGWNKAPAETSAA